MNNFEEQKISQGRQKLSEDEDTANPLPSSTLIDQAVLEVGTMIADRYKVLALIGSGSVGHIYKAQQIATGRVVALKMLNRRLLDDKGRQRFDHEAKIASAINHPNTIAIYDFGQTLDGELYLAMEYVEGESLDNYMKRRQQPISEVVDIFLQITDALRDAHEKGIIHRDLKPSNVILTQSKKRSNIVKILDFAIAKRAEDGRQSVSNSGEVTGSPLYMSPEQCNSEKLTPASDIYSLGCMLYEALSGVPPHVGNTVISTMYKQCHHPAKRFSQVRPDLKIPTNLEAITLKCLNKNPVDRYYTVNELHDQLLSLRENAEAAEDKGGRTGLLALGISLVCVVLILAACYSYQTYFAKPITKSSAQNAASPDIKLSETMALITEARKLDSDAKIQ